MKDIASYTDTNITIYMYRHFVSCLDKDSEIKQSNHLAKNSESKKDLGIGIDKKVSKIMYLIFAIELVRKFMH